MFAIGLLSLLSLGFVTMLSTGDEETDDLEMQDSQDDGATGNISPAPPDLIFDFMPEDDDRAEADAEEETGGEDIAGTPPAAADEPGGSPADEEEVEENIFADLGEDEDTDDTTGAAETGAEEAAPEVQDSATEDNAVARPPMGDQYRDPLKIAEEAEEQRILDEIAAEEARQPENLVTVSDADGAQVDDGLVMTETGDGSGHFLVTPPETANDIAIGYDAASTFDIQYNAATATITAGLNSDIEGPDGTLSKTTTEQENEDGETVTVVTWTKVFDHGTDITLAVDQDQIGTHVARIDLTNPQDTLHFDFDPDVTGNLHLVYSEVEEGVTGSTNTTMRAFVIQTAADVTSLSAEDVAALLAEDSGTAGDTHILAEIFLGEDTLFVNSAQSANDAGEIRIMNFVNDTPAITTSIDWASVSDLADIAPAEGSGGEEGTGGDDGRDDEDDDLDLTLFPGIDFPFGFIDI